MTAAVRRVIKLGGSLLDWPELPAKFQSWLDTQSPAVNVVVVGGGQLVEQIRAWDRLHPLGDEAAHWLAVRAMGLTAAIAHQWLPDSKLATRIEELRLDELRAVQILDVEHFLRADQIHHDALPFSWEVTSDSIAARVAAVLHANELVLLKSTMPEECASRGSWSRAGFVDVHFARASIGLAVRAVNLRDDRFLEATI